MRKIEAEQTHGESSKHWPEVEFAEELFLQSLMSHKGLKEISEVSHHEFPDKQDSQILLEVGTDDIQLGLIRQCYIAEN